MSRICTVVVPINPLKDCRESVLALFDELLPSIRQGEGLLRYDLFERPEGGLVLIEEWESREAWQDHFEWDAIKKLKTELPELVEMPVERWEMYAHPGA